MSGISTPGGASLSPLDVSGLSVGYGTKRVIEQLDLALAPAEIVHLTGPNGCGKSTLLRTIAGRQPALAGEIVVSGHHLDVDEVAAKRSLGYASDEGLALPYLTPREHLRLIARIHGLPGSRGDDELVMLAATALGRHADVTIRTCSRGTARQVDLCAALLHRPRLLLLDEAFDGIDTATAPLWIDRIQALVDAGSSVLFTSHSEQFAAQLGADRRFDLAPNPPTASGRVRV
ncbi:MAG: hypothetical protein CSA84_03575 [Actinomycetales bacterium]|nr:MAG: hypothetical protein CSA84_03575 [Actinomycetales bacterium]